MSNKRFNFNIGEFTWLILLFAISFYFYRIVHLGEISMFINPNMNKYVIFASVSLSILGIFQIPKILNTPEGKPKFGYLIFAIPVIIGVLVNPIGLTQGITEAKGVNFTQDSTAVSTKRIINNEIKNTNSEIIMNDKNYFAFLNAISEEPNKFKNYKINLTGFVYRDENIKDGRFIIARMLMICCAADAQTVGLLCDYKGQKFDKGTWVQVTGTLDTIYYDDNKQDSLIPLIKVKSVKKIEPPVSKYIYLNNTD
ncbi:TIGR03943 family putative permease subunit [Clostridium thailandense]|uniref:TIGR03943 family putative permease subunit n=1 Tax=Clostridium thailandense TaxID=2794346 RepID=UPI003988C407